MDKSFYLITMTTFSLALGCNSFDGDITEVNLSFQQCVYLCDNTDECLSISYKQKTTLCKMHQNDTTSLDCHGYIFFKKTDWRSNTNVVKFTGLRTCEKFRTCLKISSICEEIPVPHGMFLGNRFREGQGHKIIAHCKPGYAITGRKYKECVAGNWEPEDPVCVEDPACLEYLVSGPNGVADSQLTISVPDWCHQSRNQVFCHTGSIWEQRRTRSARLNTTMNFYNGNLTTYSYGGWFAGSTSGEAYIQVNFHWLRAISTIVLQGRNLGNLTTTVEQYVTEFKAHLSRDCITFETVKDDNGQDILFNGTTGSDVIVVRSLPVRELARCVRIQPTQWNSYPSLRFDIQGC